MREILKMNSQWKFRTGDIPKAVPFLSAETYIHSKSRNALGGATKDFFDENFDVIDLPHDYVLDGEVTQEISGSHGCYKRENAWYRKAFTLSKEDENKRIVLLFEGVGTKAEIWVNDHRAGINTSMYNSFYVDITPYVTFEKEHNLVAVNIINDDFEGWWYEGAGIYRDVYLIKTNEVAVDVWGTWVNPIKTSDTSWNVPIETSIYNKNEDSQNITITQEIYDNNNNLVANTSSDFVADYDKTKFNQDLSVENPMLWTLESPIMYHAKTIISQNGVVVDEYETKFGFRTIDFDNQKGFFLNGVHTKVRGVCLHQDHANLGVAFYRSVWEYRLRLLKEAGVNACRCAHGNPAPEFLDLCDEMGMLVMDENRCFNFNTENKSQLKSMVLRDRNHPSIFIWSIGNEEPLQNYPTGKKLISLLRGIVKKLDNTRPVSLVLSGSYNHETDISDYTCFNYQIENYDEFYKLNGNKLMFSTETGAADNNRGIYHVDNEEAYAYDYATAYDLKHRSFSDSYLASITQSELNDFMGGTFIWAGFEYRGESTYPKLFCAVSPLDSCGFKKDNFYMMKAIWKDEKMVHILPHWNLQEGTNAEVWVYNNVEEVELIVNGTSQGKQKAGKFTPAKWNVAYAKGEVIAVGYDNGVEVVRSTVKTTGAPKDMVISQENMPSNNGDDCVIVNVCMKDENGLIVPTASNKITFNVDDNLELKAVSNGDPLDHTSARSNSFKMFNGYIQVIAKVKKGATTGVITVCDEDNNVTLNHTVELVSKTPAPSVPDFASKIYIENFRKWNVYPQSDIINHEFDFSDNNSNILVNMFDMKFDTTQSNTVLTAIAITPKAVDSSEISVRIEDFKGKGQIKIAHSKNTWPYSEPKEYKTIVQDMSSTDKTDIDVVCQGFSQNEKVEILLVIENEDSTSIGGVRMICK